MENLIVLPQQRTAIITGFLTHNVVPLSAGVPQADQPLNLYFKLADGSLKLLAETRCAGVQTIDISDRGLVTIAGVGMDHSDVRSFAQTEKFDSPAEFVSYIRETFGLPFEGHVIHWYRPETCYA